jgi:hypothetical protein
MPSSAASFNERWLSKSEFRRVPHYYCQSSDCIGQTKHPLCQMKHLLCLFAGLLIQFFNRLPKRKNFTGGLIPIYTYLLLLHTKPLFSGQWITGFALGAAYKRQHMYSVRDSYLPQKVRKPRTIKGAGEEATAEIVWAAGFARFILMRIADFEIRSENYQVG